MQFLRELYILAKAAPALANRYRSQWLLVLISGGISVISDVAGSHWFKDAPQAKLILHYASLATLAITILVSFWAYFSLLASRFQLNELVCREVTVEAQYSPPDARTYSVVETSKCINRTDGPIVDFSTFKDGYWNALDNWSVVAQIVQQESRTASQIEMIGAPVHETWNLIDGKNIEFYHQTARFTPPFAAGEYCTVVCRITANGDVEAEAFTAAGTEFARSVSFNTLAYNVAIHAPPAYKIVLHEFNVLNADHSRNDSETKRQKKPRLSDDGSSMMWNVTLARQNLKYSLRYRFVDSA
ncbi:MAG TPA: hypothetical protein VMA09_11855 [Candidatus Binataceae bacterium]|nr:hypothetical protein [Candidatus Binataceae bacterium]